MDYKVYKEKNYTIHTIKTDKFKNCVMEIMLTQEMDKKKVTRRTMLNDLLAFTSKKYQTRRELSIELEKLYNAYVRCSATRYGNRFVTSFVTSFLNPKYCEEGYLDDVIELPFEMLLNPNIEDGKYNKRSFDIVKNRLKSELESIRDNATRYAVRRSLELMDDKSISSVPLIGYLEDLDSITEDSIISDYNDLINNSACDIYVVGNLDMDEVVRLIKKYFKKDKCIENNINMHVTNAVKDKVLDIQESGRYEQSSLILLYNLIDFTKRERDIVFNVFNYIFGSGGLTSKLYRYVREDNSLCYALNSSYEKYDSLCMVYVGANHKDKDKCRELINIALQEMIDGKFSDDELIDTKNSIVTMLSVSEDSIGGIIMNYFYHDVDDTLLMKEKIEAYLSVTKNEIMNVAKKIRENTCYLLLGEDEK